MEIYDSRYFIHNKRFQKALGVWPYQSRAKNIVVCGLLLLLMLGMLLPQIVRLKKYAGKDSDKMMENIFILFYIFGIYIKLFTAVYAENRLKVLYESTAKNFQIYTGEAERRILYEYSERGRLLTLAFIVYMLPAVTVYVMLPMCPIIMDAAKPLDHPRYRMFILNGDYLVDEYDYYFYIYAFDSMAAIVTVAIMCATDPMYAAIVEHCLGLFSICKLRLKNFNKPNGTKAIEKTYYYSETCGDEYAYAALVKVVQLHKDIFKYTEIMQASYSLYFLLEMGVTMGVVVCNSVIIVMKLSQPLELVRWSLVLIGGLLHIFFLTWPGQKLINFSGDIFQDTYLNDWYESSLRCQKLLKFMSLRCLKPCELSGGGLYVMNFINFATILKTSASYITVFSSF
ncbi:odorant receptor 133 [Nasonia vitripennis]|uniref:Odorant receptor n=1 Tax=Nasonia vitripennis TaxID=7425 RepID=A0A7M6UW78_NASVI|nr:odorant receptor 133 [Nasonia vitripennis]